MKPNRDEPVELSRLADPGELIPEIDSVFAPSQARIAFERTMMSGKHGKVVLQVGDEER